MSSPSLDAGAEARPKAKAVGPLLDSAFGHFVWAAHFLTIYIATAISCQLGLRTASPSTGATFLTVLALVTVAAAAIVVFHALRRYRQYRELPDLRFRMSVTIGNDAIATVGITWQLFAILLVPACA